MANTSLLVDLPTPPNPQQWINEIARSRPVLIAFDFDGTLAPIVDRPKDARLPEFVQRATLQAAEKFSILLCTGRALSDLKTFLPPRSDRLYLIGNHGAEWELPGLCGQRDHTPQSWKTWRSQSMVELEQIVSQYGGEIEDKVSSIAIHYRLSGLSWWSSPSAFLWLETWLKGQGQILRGESSWNLMPLGTSKGASLSQFMKEFGFQHVIYFGDEPTDETVFTLQHPELQVSGVKVGQGPTAARFRVADVSAVHDRLVQLAQA